MKLRYPFIMLLIFISIMVMRNKIRGDDNNNLRDLDCRLIVLNKYCEGQEFKVLSLRPLIFKFNEKWICIEGPWPEKKVFKKILSSQYDSIRIRFRNQLIIPRR